MSAVSTGGPGAVAPQVGSRPMADTSDAGAGAEARGGRGRLRVAVVFGGRSSEHAISCVSAGSVLRALDREAYDVVPVGITTDGRWVLAPDDPEPLTIE